MTAPALCQQLRVMLEALAVATEELSKAHEQLQHEYARGFTDGLATKDDEYRPARFTIWCCERHHTAVLHHWQSLTCCASPEGRPQPRSCCHWATLEGPAAVLFGHHEDRTDPAADPPLPV
jgi:hypothetical protein